MKNKIYLLICFFIGITWGCKNELVEELQQQQDYILSYNGNNILGKAFVESLSVKTGGCVELGKLFGTSKQLMLDHTMQGCNTSDGCFYVIPICDKRHNLVDAFLLATLDMDTREKSVGKLNKYVIIDQEALQHSHKLNQYESYFLTWNVIGLNIKPELYNIAKKLHEDFFVGTSRANEYYQTYEYKVDYRWDYSMLLFPTDERIKNHEVRYVFNDMVNWLQMELGIDPIYNARADTISLYVSFYAPRYTLDEIKAVTGDFRDRLRNGIDFSNTPTFMGIRYKYYNESVKGYLNLPDPDPDPENPVDPWLPEVPSMPEDNQLEIHHRFLSSVFVNMPKVFRDSLFKGDSLADSREYRSLGKSYIHALVEFGQTGEQVLSNMRIFFNEQMELFFENGNPVHLAMALHPIIDSYCLGHEKRYWMNEEWHYDVIHRFEGKFIFYNDDSAVMKALKDIYQSVIVNGQRDLNTIFNAWLYSFSYGPLNGSNIIN